MPMAANEFHPPPARQDYEQLTVFARPEDIVAIYVCEHCGLRGTHDETCGTNADCSYGCVCSRCGIADAWYPVGCNFHVLCINGCEQTGCNASDCCTSARDGSCPLCGGPATVTEQKAEPVNRD